MKPRQQGLKLTGTTSAEKRLKKELRAQIRGSTRIIRVRRASEAIYHLSTKNDPHPCSADQTVLSPRSKLPRLGEKSLFQNATRSLSPMGAKANPSREKCQGSPGTRNSEFVLDVVAAQGGRVDHEVNLKTETDFNVTIQQ